MNAHGLPVDVAIEVEEMHFDTQAFSINGRPHAEVHHAWTIIIREDRVDANRRKDFDHAADVRGRKTNRASATIATFDDSVERMSTTKSARRLIEITARDGISYARARERTVLVTSDLCGGDLEAERFAEATHELEITCALRAEAKVFTDHDRLRAKSLDEKLLHESLGRESREVRSEWLDNDVVRAMSSQELDAPFECCEARWRRSSEYFAWMRIEGQRDRRQSALGRDRASLAKHGLMTAMDSIEVADDDHG